MKARVLSQAAVAPREWRREEEQRTARRVGEEAREGAKQKVTRRGRGRIQLRCLHSTFGCWQVIAERFKHHLDRGWSNAIARGRPIWACQKLARDTGILGCAAVPKTDRGLQNEAYNSHPAPPGVKLLRAMMSSSAARHSTACLLRWRTTITSVDVRLPRRMGTCPAATNQMQEHAALREAEQGWHQCRATQTLARLPSAYHYSSLAAFSILIAPALVELAGNYLAVAEQEDI